MAYNGNRPVNNPNECVMCDACLNKCPAGAMEHFIVPGSYKIIMLVDVEKCCNITCSGECWNICPLACLDEYPCISKNCS